MLSDGDLTLRPVAPEDLDALYLWDIDPQTHFIAGGPRPLIPVTAERHRERFTTKSSGPDSEDFTITVDGRQVGYCQLAMFDHLARSAMVGIVLAPDARGQHIG